MATADLLNITVEDIGQTEAASEVAEDVREGEEPGASGTNFLIASDSYEEIDIPGVYVEEDVRRRHTSCGTINTIVQEGGISVSDIDQEREVEATLGRRLSLKETTFDEKEDSADNEEDMVEITPENLMQDPSWRHKNKHIFVLSSSGKPVYCRHGSDDKLVTIFGVMQALVSFINSGASTEKPPPSPKKSTDKAAGPSANANEKSALSRQPSLLDPAYFDTIQSIHAGDRSFVFLCREHLTFVAVCQKTSGDSVHQLKLQLAYVHSQILSTLTASHINRIYKQRVNYDLRRLLAGSEKFIDNLLNMMESDFSFMLGAVRCLPMPAPLRDIIAQAVLQNCKIKDLVFAMVIAKNQLITLVRMKKYFLSPQDLHLIFNLIDGSDTFKAAESWVPVCLPKFDNSGYLYAYISTLSDTSDAYIILLTVNSEQFPVLSECKQKVVSRLMRLNCLEEIASCTQSSEYSIEDVSIPSIRHFLYKSKSSAQLTGPCIGLPYLPAAPANAPTSGTTEPRNRLLKSSSSRGLLKSSSSGINLSALASPGGDSRRASGGQTGRLQAAPSGLGEEGMERLKALYRRVHHRMHSPARPLKIMYLCTQHETMLGWVTHGFELYATFGPLVSKKQAISTVNKLLKWIKREEDRLFILSPPTF